MRLDESCDQIFARHETFHPRYGWLKKAFDAAAGAGDVFNDEAAVVEMGVGKNMVKSIRHWGVAFKVIEPGARQPGSRRTPLVPTAIGRAWFDDDWGVDPYLEIPGSQWLMHWFLLAPTSQVPVWWIAFNDFAALDFTDEQLIQFVADRTSGFGKPKATAIKKDVSAFLRMYSSGHGARATFDDRVDAPFRGLGLVQPSAHDGDMYRFNVGPKATLPALIFAGCVLDFVARTDPSNRIVNLSRVLTEPGSPGRAFKLTDNAAVDLLREASEQSEVLDLRISAGIPQLVTSLAPAAASAEVLGVHYSYFGSDLDRDLLTSKEAVA